MNESIGSDKFKKYLKVVGAMCLVIAALGISIAVIGMMDYVKLLATHDIHYGTILFFIAGVVRFWACVAYAVSIFICVALSVIFIISGIALIRQTNAQRTKRAVAFSFAVSLTICMASVYPFVISVCRIIAHGYLQEYYFGFWCGMAAFVSSILCLVFNRIAVKKYNSAHPSLLNGSDRI